MNLETELQLPKFDSEANFPETIGGWEQMIIKIRRDSAESK
jgi:hypothetical protein